MSFLSDKPEELRAGGYRIGDEIKTVQGGDLVRAVR